MQEAVLGVRAESVTRVLDIMQDALLILDEIGTVPHLGARLDEIIEDLKECRADPLAGTPVQR